MRSRRRRARRPHAVLLAVFAVGWMICLFVTISIAGQLVLMTALWWFARRTATQRADVGYLFRAAASLLLLYTLIGGLLSTPPNAHVLWLGPHVPGLGVLELSRESLVASFTRALRLWNLLFLLSAIGAVVSPEDIAQWFGRRYSRVALTFAMVLQFIPNLLSERQRIAEVVQMRGAVSSSSPFRVRLRAQAVVYQALLTNALERAWAVAESMHVRGYGSGRRTVYTQAKWRTEDVAMLGVQSIAMVLSLGVWINLHGTIAPLYERALLVVQMACQVMLSLWMGVRVSGARRYT